MLKSIECGLTATNTDNMPPITHSHQLWQNMKVGKAIQQKLAKVLFLDVKIKKVYRGHTLEELQTGVKADEQKVHNYYSSHQSHSNNW